MTRMLLILSLLISIASNSSASGIKLTHQEQKLINSVGISTKVALELKKYAKPNKINQLAPSESAWGKTNFKGISFSASEDSVSKILQFHSKLKKEGFLLFRSKMNFGYKPEQFSIIKSKDQYDILRYSGTDGINYDITNKDVIAKLKEWEEKYPFEIIGADLDWVQARFVGKSKDLSKLAKEIYEFCPDVVDQGTGTVRELELEMEKDKSLYLWWD